MVNIYIHNHEEDEGYITISVKNALKNKSEEEKRLKEKDMKEAIDDYLMRYDIFLLKIFYYKKGRITGDLMLVY